MLPTQKARIPSSGEILAETGRLTFTHLRKLACLSADDLRAVLDEAGFDDVTIAGGIGRQLVVQARRRLGT